MSKQLILRLNTPMMGFQLSPAVEKSIEITDEP